MDGWWVGGQMNKFWTNLIHAELSGLRTKFRISMCLYHLLQKILAKENKRVKGGFPGDPVAKNPPANVGDALEPVSHNYWAHGLQLLEPKHLEPMLHNKRTTARRSPHTATREPQQWRSSVAKNKIKIKSFFKKKCKVCKHLIHQS